MSDELTLKVRRCPHGSWHGHNAFRLPDGTVVDDPEGSCPGGVVEVEGQVLYIPIALATWLDQVVPDD